MMVLIKTTILFLTMFAKYIPIGSKNSGLLGFDVNQDYKDETSNFILSESEDNCETPDGRSGNCTSLPNCQYIFYQLKFTPGFNLDSKSIAMVKRHQCGFDGFNPKVCCPLDTTSTESTSTTSVPPAVSPIIDNRYIESNQPNILNHPNLRLLPDSCGYSDKDKIFGGGRTGIFDYPWMALLSYKRFVDDGVVYECGGSIINERYVLTAAHCLTNLRDKYLDVIRLGEHDIRTEQDCEGPEDDKYCAPIYQEYGVEKVFIHPNYNILSKHNDIGLIRLNRTIEFDFNRDAICLPVSDTLINQNYVGVYMTIAGWGTTENETQNSQTLLDARVPVVDNEVCKPVYRNLKKPKVIIDDQMCAGGENGTDSCRGDSGGPMIGLGQLRGSWRYIQFGVVSYGPKNCATDKMPAVYTRVTSYIFWLLDQLEP